MTRWNGGAQEKPAEVIVELEQPADIGQIVIELGGFVTDFPARLQIDVSPRRCRMAVGLVGEARRCRPTTRPSGIRARCRWCSS